MNKFSFDPSKIILRGINSSDQDFIKDFDCGNGSMQSYLRDEAYYNHITREASTTLVFYEGEIVGYFTLYRSPILIRQGSDETTRDALALARLAVAKQYQNKGIGTYIIKRIREIAYLTNEMYIKTDALYERWEWYQKRGFKHVIDEEINPETTAGFVYMIMELLDETLIEEYFKV